MSEEKRKAKAWKDLEDTLAEFDALPESEREEMLYRIDRRNFETVEKVELERLRGIEARLNAEIAERRAIEEIRPETYFQLYEMDVELLERIRDGSGDDE